MRDTVSPSDIEEVPYIGLEHIGENTLSLVGHGTSQDVVSAKSSFRRGDVLFGKLRPYFRKTIRAPFDGICSTDIWVVRPEAHIDPGFLFYTMAKQQFVDFASQTSEGTRMPRAKWDYVAQIQLRLPPLPEQRRIAHILGTLDDKIELNRRMNQTLDEMARAIFKDWFVDFGPVRAKMEDRDAYLPNHIWKLFPDSLADSELGQIPDGWEVFLLDDVADYQRSSVSPYKQPDTLFEHYSIPAFDKGEQPAADMGSAIKSIKAFVPAGSVLLSKLNPDIPRVWIPNPPSDMKQIASTEFLTFVPRSGIGQGVLYCLFKSVRFRQMLEGMVTGTSRSHQRVPYQALLKSAALSGIPEMFEVFDHTVASLIARMLANRSEVQSLAAMRDTLLPKLVSGEVRINT